MAERPWVAISVAAITAVATVTAAWLARSGDTDIGKRGDDVVVAQPGAPSRKETAPQEPANRASDLVVETASRYDYIKEVREGETFNDPLTGVVVGVHRISNWWLLGPAVRCSITFPESTRLGKRLDPEPRHGTAYDFGYKGRNFHLIIEKVDLKEKAATLRVREL